MSCRLRACARLDALPTSLPTSLPNARWQEGMAAQAEYLKQLLGDVGSNVQTLFEDESLLLFDDQGDFGSATLSAMIDEFKSEAKITDETNEHHIAVTIALTAPATCSDCGVCRPHASVLSRAQALS